MTNNYILIGKIVNTFGLKGELKISSESDFLEERFKINNLIYFKQRNNYLPHKISSFRLHKGNPLITIDDLNDINQATNYVGFEIYASKDDNPSLKDNEYFIDDLVDLKVFLEDNSYVGIVKDVILMPKPTKDLLEIIKEDKTELLIPISDDFIINVSDKIIIRKVDVVNDHD